MKTTDKILVINSGSSSMKFTIYSTVGNTQEPLASGLVERIGTANANMIYKRPNKPKTEAIVKAKNHADALDLITHCLVDTENGVMKSMCEVEAIGHRIVHGGEIFKHSTLITPPVMEQLKTLVNLAPLHMPPNIGGVEACMKIFPGVPNVAVFDTAFHQTIPDYANRYAIPEEFHVKYGLRKYGFHGTSHHFVTLATANFLGKKPEELKLITCHLGNGSSLAAVKYGKSIDTTMGLTPLAGLVMGTRCGDIDPALVFFLMREGMSADEIDNLLNKQSGLYGVGGLQSGDMRDISTKAAEGVDSARLALEVWAYRVVTYIGSYNTILGGADAIVFTGGIGENCRPAREAVLRQLDSIGCFLDKEANDTKSGPCFLSKPESKIAAIIMPTDEELMIARETISLVEEPSK